MSGKRKTDDDMLEFENDKDRERTQTGSSAKKKTDGKRTRSGSENSSSSASARGRDNARDGASRSGEQRARKGAEKERTDEPRYTEPRSAKMIHQFIPYLWLVLCIFLVVCFFCIDILHKEQALGPAGYYLNRFLLGCFGYGALALPLILLNLALFWRQYIDRRMTFMKLGMSVGLLCLVSSVIHVCAHHAGVIGLDTKIGVLYENGAMLKGGGVLGGYIGWLCDTAFNLVGSLIVLIALAIILLMFLVGVTPLNAWTEIRYHGKKWLDARAERKKQKRAAKEEAERERAEEDSLYNDPTASLVGGNGPRRKPGVHYDTDNYDEVHAVALAGGGEAGRAVVPVAEDTAKPKKTRRLTPAIRPAEDDGLVLNEEALDENFKPLPAAPAHEDAQNAAPVPAAAAAPTAERSPFDLGDSLIDDEPENVVKPIELPAPQEELILPDDPEPEVLFPSGEGDAGTRTVIFGETTEKTPAPKQAPAPKTAPASAISIADDLFDEEPEDEEDRPTALDPNADIPDEDEEEVPEVEEAPLAEYKFPPISMLKPADSSARPSVEMLEENKKNLLETLESFKVRIREISYCCGPTITRYELKPEAGVRVRAIANLSDDIAMSLAAPSIRIEAPIAGKNAVGVEVPNRIRATVSLRELIESQQFAEAKSKLSACLGSDIEGNPVIFDIAKMPHLLVAGTTGSGKSVCINSIIMSLLYKATPDQVKLILIDPKKVEFNVYKDIPHLYAPIVSNPKKAAGALASAVGEMERRYELIEEVGVRNIAGYNAAMADDPTREYLPYIVIIIDELADLMMTAKEDVETAICRIAQKARAAGMHLIIGTQRPSVDVVTGLIKANVPSRIAFTVTSQVDSRTIIDFAGAEKLTGRGDMLFAPVGSRLTRVQGAFVGDDEVENVVNYVKQNNATANYNEEFAKQIEIEAAKCGNKKAGGPADLDSEEGEEGSEDGGDPKFREALEVAIAAGKISTSLLQRRLEVGYGRAAKLIDQMEKMGYVSAPDGNKPRRVLITQQDYLEKSINEDPMG